MTKHVLSPFLAGPPDRLSCPHCEWDCGLHMDDLRVEVDIGDGEGSEEFHFQDFERGFGPLHEVKGGKPTRRNPLTCRGSRLSLRVWCEACGSSSRLALGFHKGMLRVGVEMGDEGNYYAELEKRAKEKKMAEIIERVTADLDDL